MPEDPEEVLFQQIRSLRGVDPQIRTRALYVLIADVEWMLSLGGAGPVPVLPSARARLRSHCPHCHRPVTVHLS